MVDFASIAWTDEGVPIATQFNDVYFSREDGMAETDYVFLQHNNLCERFQNLTEKDTFVVGETGFGTGLNFLCTWRLFEQIAPLGARLHFISVEKFPICKKTLQCIMAFWPSLECFSQLLLQHYPVAPLPGYCHLSLGMNKSVQLTLIFDDISALAQLNGIVHAWFLDGFSPARNSSMWVQSVFSAMARHSCERTTYATFTAARIVQDHLGQAGFSVVKTQGFGKKRHMLHGCYIPKKLASYKQSQPWLQRDAYAFDPRKAIVIGAGIAGCSSARALSQRGWNVLLIDKALYPANGGASGNRQGALYVRLSGTTTLLSRFVIQGFYHSLHLLRRYYAEGKGIYWDDQGLIQVAFDAKEMCRQQRILTQNWPESFVTQCSARRLSSFAQMALMEEGLFFKEGGWVNLHRWCCALIAQGNIQFSGGHDVLQLIRTPHRGWQVQCQHECFFAPVVILANSEAVKLLEQTAFLPVKAMRGQLTYIPANENSRRIRTVLCGKSYVLPEQDGMHVIGATHQFNDYDCSVRIMDHRHNVQALRDHFPAIYKMFGMDAFANLKALGGRASFRCTTPDLWPIVGPVADKNQFDQQFKPLRYNAKHSFHEGICPDYLPGLYVNVGHGSRGLVTAPLSGEILANFINNELLIVSNEVMKGMHPSRFLARSLMKFQTLYS